MEERHHQKPARIGHSTIPDAPLEKHSHHHKRAILVVGVVMSMIIILGLYAASFKHRNLIPHDAGDLSRWGIIQEEFLDDSTSVIEGFKEITGTVTGVINANKVRAESITILKDKLADSASGTEATDVATSTPDTVDTSENAPLQN